MPSPDATTTPRPRRGAAGTRQALLSAARGRFATQGYAGTTVRDIADDAGVNVSLINRYFSSKEGLFEACLVRAAGELGQSVAGGITLDEVADLITAQIAGPDTSEHPHQLVMLLRTSGDDRAEQIRLETLRTYAARLATVAGGDADDAQLLRAELALSAVFGMAVLRTTTSLEPLASASQEELAGAVRTLVRALLTPP